MKRTINIIKSEIVKDNGCDNQKVFHQRAVLLRRMYLLNVAIVSSSVLLSLIALYAIVLYI